VKEVMAHYFEKGLDGNSSLHPFRLWGRYEELDWSSIYLLWTMVFDLVLHFIIWLLTCDFDNDFRYVVNDYMNIQYQAMKHQHFIFNGVSCLCVSVILKVKTAQFMSDPNFDQFKFCKISNSCSHLTPSKYHAIIKASILVLM
jgi:hypothetical protein